MAEVPIYQLDLTLADVTVSGVYYSSTWGGTDTPDANYPNFGQLENLQRRENAGASGQHVLDAIDTANYTITWITLCGVGALSNGQFDARGGGAGSPLKYRWTQFFKSSALAESAFSCPLVMCNGGTDGSGSGLFAPNRFLALYMFQDTGTTFQWDMEYRTVSGDQLLITETNPSLTGFADTSDDAEHAMEVTMVPSTVTGAFAGHDGAGGLGSASVASDGSILVTVDGVTVFNVTGVQFVINNYATANPNVYYGKTIWHGD